MKKVIFVFALILGVCLNAQTKLEDINEKINKGEFTAAIRLIDEKIANEDLNVIEIYDLQFEKERLLRIKKDFRRTEKDILDYVDQYYPDATVNDLKKWEDDGTLEYKIIDGQKLYFNRAHANLFRVNKQAKQKKIDTDGFQKDELDLFIEKYMPHVIDEAKASDDNLVMPVTMKLNYKLVVDADVVPAGEVIRCWLPYPRELNKRQVDIKLLGANDDNYIISPEDYVHSSLYMEKKTVAGQKTVFEYEMQYTAYNEWHELDPNEIKPYNKESELYKKYTTERLPHIVFTDKVKELSKEIVGSETNPIIASKKIYKWINDNIPWAGAREYSTIRNISDYCLTNGWGDCGIKTLTFMTLCRYNGIPAKWQSGWMLHPGSINLHDWGEVYFEGIGWVPVDQSFGLVDSDDEDVKWFYLGGIDAFHFVVNDDYSQGFYPAKIYPRSETVDFQRGEVEWKGGNLYFDQWDYFMNVEYLDQDFSE